MPRKRKKKSCDSSDYDDLRKKIKKPKKHWMAW